MIKKLFVMLVFFATFLSVVSALNEVYISPNSLSVTQGQTFSVDVNGIALVNTSDVFGVQFDMIYDTSKLSISSVVGGDFLNNGSTTLFDYNSISGGIRVYNVRNAITGVYGEGSFATVNFNTIGSGSSPITISNVIWVNSTITNDSVETVDVSVLNSSITINSVPGSTTSGGSSGGGGGGGSSTKKTNITNQTQGGSSANTGTVGEESNPKSNGDEGFTGTSDSNENQNNKGFLALTGNIIGSAAVSALRSWIFYFVLGIVIAFVSVLLVRKHRQHHVK
jgi:hypothetical protein